MRIQIGLLILLMGCLACERILNVTLPYEGNKFVVFGELSPQQVVSVRVERTYPPTGEVQFSTGYLNMTKVTLIEDNQDIEVLRRIDNSNVFISTRQFKPKVGRSYQIRVEAPDFATAISEPQNIPLPVKNLSAVFSEKIVFSPLNERNPTKWLEVKFEKPVGIGIYLVAEIEGLHRDVKTSSNVISDRSVPEFGSPCAYSFSSSYKVFNGDCFNGSKNQLNFYVELEGTVQSSSGGGVTGNNVRIDAVSIKLSTSNEFNMSFYSNLSPTDGFLKAFETSKSTVTNVRNGYGGILVKNESSIRIPVPVGT